MPSPGWSNRPASGLAAFAGCLVFAIAVAVPAILNDSDTLWQIRTGDWILAHHAIPWTDPFSFTAGDRRWFPHEWLAEVLLSLAHQAGGLEGVMVLAAAAAGLAAGLLFMSLSRVLPPFRAFEGLVLAASAAAPSLLARPHLLAWPCLVLWCDGLIRARAVRSAPSLWLLPVMVIWVNLHGSFMAGLLLPFAFAAEAMLDPDADRYRAARDWGVFILAAWAAALINPAFADGLLFPFHMLGMQSLGLIGEWAPPDFSKFQPVEVVILAGLALGFTTNIRLPPIRLLLLLGLVHAALTHSRNQQLLGIVGALILAEPVAAMLPGVQPSAPKRWIMPGAAFLALAALCLRLTIPLGLQRSEASFAAAIATVPADIRARPVLNAYAYGGDLIFAGVRPFIDSRADLYGDGFIHRYLAAVGDDRALRQVLEADHIVWTIFPAADPMISRLDALPGWRRLSDTNGVMIHIRSE